MAIGSSTPGVFAFVPSSFVERSVVIRKGEKAQSEMKEGGGRVGAQEVESIGESETITDEGRRMCDGGESRATTGAIEHDRPQNGARMRRSK